MGVGIIPDSLATIRYLEVDVEEIDDPKWLVGHLTRLEATATSNAFVTSSFLLLVAMPGAPRLEAIASRIRKIENR